MQNQPALLAGRKGRIAAALPLLALALSGCVSTGSVRLAPGEERLLVGPAVRDNRTPMDPALACLANRVAAKPARPLVIAVGDVRDYTGKYSVGEGNAITQGGSLMVASALGKLGSAVRIAERFDPGIAERELAYTDRRQLGDGALHNLASPSGRQNVPWLPYFGGSIAASDYYIVGGITEVNYNIRSGGLETGINSTGPKHRTYTEQVAIDLRLVDTRSLLVVRTVSLTKQFTGYESGFGIFRFFGSDLFDISLGAKGQEPLQLGIRTALEEGVLRLVGTAAGVDTTDCLAQASWLSATPRPSVPYLAARTFVPPISEVGAAAFNRPATIAGAGQLPDTSLTFEVGADTLPGAADAMLDSIAAGASHGAQTVTLLARDSEVLNPAKRQELTNRRVATLVAALVRRGIAANAISVIWRPDASDPSPQRDGAGLQRLARLQIG